MFKPFLAVDVDLEKVRYPILVMPKIDGVRALNVNGEAVGRSLKPIRNEFTRQRFSQSWMGGLDGELTVGSVTDPDLCRMTTSATSRIAGEPDVKWNIFDIHSNLFMNKPYAYRLEKASERVERFKQVGIPEARNLQIVPSAFANNEDDILAAEAHYLEQGYEGLILRAPDAPYKCGRATVKEGSYLRLKRFVLAEAVVVGITEGQRNDNPALTNELGHTYRTTHQENMIGNGMVGSLQCCVVKKVVEWGREVLSKDQLVDVSPGNMDHSMRAFYFGNQNQLLGKSIVFKFFPLGIKDKPRFPTFVSVANPT